MNQQVNLYHPIFRKKEKKFSAVAMLQAGGAIIAGIVLLYGLQLWQHYSQKKELAQIDKQQAMLTKRLEDVSQKFGRRTKSRLLQQEVDRLQRQLIARARVQEILQQGVFSNTYGYSTYFIAFARQHISGMWLTGFDITGGGEEMSLQGRSTDPALIPRYVQKLASEDTLNGTEFEIFQILRPQAEDKKRNANYVEFLIKTAHDKTRVTP